MPRAGARPRIAPSILRLFCWSSVSFCSASVQPQSGFFNCGSGGVLAPRGSPASRPRPPLPSELMVRVQQPTPHATGRREATLNPERCGGHRATPKPAWSLSTCSDQIGLSRLYRLLVTCFTSSTRISTHYLIELVGKAAKEQPLMQMTCASTALSNP